MPTDVSQVSSVLNQACSDKVQEIADDYASRLIAYIRYEFIVAQMELASSWKKHGYDFKFMPDQFIQNIRVQNNESEGLDKSIRITIPSENFKGEDQTKIDFFQKYVVNNAAQRLQTMK